MDHRRLRQGAGTSAFILAPSLQIPMHQRVSPSCLCCQAGRGRDAWSQGNPIPHANPGLSAQPSSSQHEGITKFYVWLTNSSLIQPWEGGKKLFLLNPLPARILHRTSQIAPLAAQAAACRLGHFPGCLMLQVMGLLPARSFWEKQEPNRPFPLRKRSAQPPALAPIFIQPERPEYWGGINVFARPTQNQPVQHVSKGMDRQTE